MTTVKLSEFAVNAYYGKSNFTPQQAYDFVKEPVETLEANVISKPVFQKLQKTAVKTLDKIVGQYDLKMDEKLNSEKSEAGRKMGNVIYNYDAKVCGMIVSSSWGIF